MAADNKVSIQEWIYTQRPGTDEVSESHYKLSQREVELTGELSLDAGAVVLRTLFCSVDPYMRIQQAASDSWESPHALDTVQGGGTVLQVEQSRNDKWPVGRFVVGYTGWASKVVFSAEAADKNLSDLTSIAEAGLPLSYALSILGMPARTAYFGLLEAGKPKAGETVIVSGAAGAVGSIVVQIAKLHGCRVVGIAGSQDKLEFVRSLGADELIDYSIYGNDTGKIKAALQAAAPNGVDVYFDNVGGWITDAVLELINVRARVVICGAITQYNGGLDAPELGPRFLHRLIFTRATIQGILARDFTHRMPEMIETIMAWLKEGKITYRETVWEGFAKLPAALQGLFQHKNTGKMVVKVGEAQ